MSAVELTFHERVAEAVDNPAEQLAVATGARAKFRNRAHAVAEFPAMEATRERARLIRAHTLSQLPQYLAQFSENVEARGGQVFWAQDAAECNRYITNLAQARGVRHVVKSKSMLTEEVALNDALQAAGVEVVESDLGEFILQLCGQKPAHIIAPVMHMTRHQVGAVFARELGVPFSDDPATLNATARSHLRRVFLEAGMGISGVNFAVAESGALCLVTNEGNGRLTTTAPRIHVAVMGMERLVPTLADLSTMLQLLARSATGQKLSVYSNIINGPRRDGECDGPEELHVVILDNGRSRILGSELAEVLYCIRCGACLNACPVFHTIGGHAYGSVYSGPVGAVLSPLLFGEKWLALPHASSLCAACREVCPVDIDLPDLLLRLRAEEAASGHAPLWLRLGLRAYAAIARRPAFFSSALRAGRVAGALLGSEGWIGRLPGPLAGWSAQRDFPQVAARPFRSQWKKRRQSEVGQ